MGKPARSRRTELQERYPDVRLPAALKGTTRVRKHIDAVTVLRMALIGSSLEEISFVTGVHVSTLQDRLKKDPDLRRAYEYGQAKMRTMIRRKQLQKALAGPGDTGMLIWLGKQVLGQRERVDVPPDIRIQDGDRTVTVSWSDELEERFQAVDAEFESLEDEDGPQEP